MDITKPIPISAIAEVLYCPRNFYYRMVEGAVETNEYVTEGRAQEEMRENRKTQVRGQVKQYRYIQAASEKLGIIGVLDIVEECDGKRYPVENKRGSIKQNIHDDVQLCCQALLLEEQFGETVPFGFVYYVESNQRRIVHFTEELRDTTLDTIECAKAILADGQIPEPVNDNRCIGCSLIERCLPQETAYLRGNSNKPVRLMASANLGRILYVDSPGAYLRKRDGYISVTREKETLQQIPFTAVDQIVMIGQVNGSSAVWEECLKRGISTYFYNYYGKLSGWLQPVQNKNSLLRIAQVRAYDQQERKLLLAKNFVQGKIYNARALLLRYNRTLRNEAIAEACDMMGKCLKKIFVQKDLDALLGIEGLAGKTYFNVLPLLVKNENSTFYFAGRNRRPPRDPVNALLSLSYAMLAKDITNELIRVGLDPYIGFLHSAVYGRPALALDLMEEFRAIIADSAVLTAINNHMVDENDFDMNATSCQLQERGRKAFFQAYRNRMNEEITHPLFGYRVSYRRILELQARLLAKVIQGEIQEYIPFKVR